MARLVLTVIGDDRSGLVRALADVVTEHGANWEESQLAELAGKFAGIVVVSVPEARAQEFASSLSTLDGLLQVAAHPGAEAASGAAGGPGVHGDGAATDQLTIDLLGNDHPGIVIGRTHAPLLNRGDAIIHIGEVEEDHPTPDMAVELPPDPTETPLLPDAPTP